MTHSVQTLQAGALLELRAISKSFDSVDVLQNVDLEVRNGEFITVLGPSGSGKTTILRMIGGFTAPSSGDILLEGRSILGMPINRRPFNTVFQDYALFPHMTVAQNVGYGLTVRGVARADVRRRAAEAIDLVQLGDLSARMPSQLSGGQRQRVALARAIICNPRLILLDEPLAALDVELRRQMQLFLKSIQREVKATFLFVTHDQEEAIAMADRICVMNYGRILQVGTPHEVYYRPRSEFVARFFGDNNLIEGRLSHGDSARRRIETPAGPLVCAIDGQPDLAAAENGRRAFAVFRPESVAFTRQPATENVVAGTVAAVSFGGATTISEIKLGATAAGGGPLGVKVKTPSRVEGATLAPGDQVSLAWGATECRLVLA